MKNTLNVMKKQSIMLSWIGKRVNAIILLDGVI